MRSNFLKQKTAEVGETVKKAPTDKENVNSNTSPGADTDTTENKVGDKGYHKEGYVDPKKQPEKDLTEEEKQALAKKAEQEAIDRMINRAQTMR